MNKREEIINIIYEIGRDARNEHFTQPWLRNPTANRVNKYAERIEALFSSEPTYKHPDRDKRPCVYVRPEVIDGITARLQSIESWLENILPRLESLENRVKELERG